MASDLIVIYTAANLQQAFLLKNLLAEYGVPGQVLGEAIQNFAEDPSNWRSQPRVAVARGDAEFAREVARDFDQQVQRGAAAAATQGAGSGPVELLYWEDWPRCPECDEPRRTLCPACHTHGTQFPLAEFIPSADQLKPIRLTADHREDPDEPVLLTCPVCDEIFAPEFHRRCARCGHDFGVGREASVDSTQDDLHWRAATLLVLLALLVLGIVSILALALSRG